MTGHPVAESEYQALRPVYHSQLPSKINPAPKTPTTSEAIGPIVPGLPCEFHAPTPAITKQLPPIMAMTQTGWTVPAPTMTLPSDRYEMIKVFANTAPTTTDGILKSIRSTPVSRDRGDGHSKRDDERASCRKATLHRKLTQSDSRTDHPNHEFHREDPRSQILPNVEKE